MPCTFQITTPAGSIDLTSPMDWFACQAVILAQMGIKDAGPVLTEFQAATIADKARDTARRVAVSGANGGKRRD